MSKWSYEKQFIVFVIGLLIICGLISMLFISLSIKDFNKPLNDVALDGQTLASYIGLVLGTAVAFSGSWVAIRIAQAANAAQQMGNQLQEKELQLQDPLQLRAIQFKIQCSDLRINLVSAVARFSSAVNAMNSYADQYATQLAKKEGFEDITKLHDNRLPKDIYNTVYDSSKKHIGPLFQEVSEWIGIHVAENINNITPLLLIHLGNLEAIEDHSYAKKLLQSSNAITFGNISLMEFKLNQAFGNMVQGCQGIEEILSNPLLADSTYVLQLVRTLSDDPSVMINKIKSELGFDDAIKIWGRGVKI
jgi:hypothetical protein